MGGICSSYTIGYQSLNYQELNHAKDEEEEKGTQLNEMMSWWFGKYSKFPKFLGSLQAQCTVGTVQCTYSSNFGWSLHADRRQLSSFKDSLQLDLYKLFLSSTSALLFLQSVLSWLGQIARRCLCLELTRRCLELTDIAYSASDGLLQMPSIALCSYPHVKVSIRDLSQSLTTAPIFQQSHYFRQNIWVHLWIQFHFLFRF